MAQSPIFESFLQDRSRGGMADQCVNLYCEKIDGPNSPPIGAMYGTPGYTAPLVTVDGGPMRGFFTSNNGLLYAVSGNGLYSVNANYVATRLGTIASSAGPISMVESPTQILIVDGIGGWVWDFVAHTFTQVIPNATTADTGPNVAVYQDGFGIVNSAGSNQIYQSNYNDLSTFATLNGGGLGSTANNAFVQGNPQNVVTMYDFKREVWIFKQKAVEVWINQGTAGFSFAQLQGVYIPVGCIAAASVSRLGESLIWLGSDDQGGSMVYESSGYQAKPILTTALAAQIQNFPVQSDAIGNVYQTDGHYVYVLTFPSQNVSFGYDAVTGKWHQRASFSNGNMNRELGNCYGFFNDQNIVGDFVNGNIYALSDTAFTDNGAPRKWVRSWSAFPYGAEMVPMSFDQLQILMETGVSVPSGTNPQIMLRWSDDGGYTWTDGVFMSAGKIGQTAWRVIQNRLGSTKIGTGLDRVFEISGVDPIRISITGASWEGGPS